MWRNGRRPRLKILWGNPRAGSSPAIRTIPTVARPLTSNAPIAAALASAQLIQHDGCAVRYVPAVRRRNLANVITGQIYSGRVAVAYVQGSAQRRQRLVITQGYEHPA